MTPLNVLKPADFATDQLVRWCPGCGDYSILAQMKKVCANLKMDRSKMVFVSGIGCSSRFPYYMNTYGFHTIHGRAPTIATGLKIARPDLDVWVVTGDGDALSIGGNHFLHLMRRNVNLKILLFNNRIYGLTKGQYSPTSEQGKVTKSTPMGSLEQPLRPVSVAIAAGATFVARALDVDAKNLESVLERAAQHKGTAFVEIYQNCNIFNDGAYAFAADKNQRPDNVLQLEHNKPMIFGANRDQGIRLDGFAPRKVDLAHSAIDDLLIHDEKTTDPSLAFLLSRMSHPEFPEPMGVFRDVNMPAYDELVHQQIQHATQTRGKGSIQKLLAGENPWRVE